MKKRLSEEKTIGQIKGNVSAWRMGISSAEQALEDIEKRIEEYEQSIQDMLDDIATRTGL